MCTVCMAMYFMNVRILSVIPKQILFSEIRGPFTIFKCTMYLCIGKIRKSKSNAHIRLDDV